MRTVQLKISEIDFQKYKFGNNQDLLFEDLVKKINLEFAGQALINCNQIAQINRLFEMSIEEINEEIKKVISL
jgi:citrate lyase beta subunit